MTNTNISGVIIGINTHKSIHVAVAIDNNGSRLTAFSAPATTKGYKLLEDWACALGTITAFDRIIRSRAVSSSSCSRP